MSMLDEETLSKAKELLAAVQEPVTILFFKSKDGCRFCTETEALLQEIKNLNPSIKLEPHVIETDKDIAREYEIDLTPAIVLKGKEKRFVRFFGIPAGYEFSSFLSAIIDVSKGAPPVSPEIAENARKVDFPVHIKVFVTPQCPYCPAAVKAAHDLALLNPNIKGDGIEVMEFQELGVKYDVMSVPKTVINEKLQLIGAYPLDVLLKKIFELKM